MHAQHGPVVGKNGGGTEGCLAWVKSSVAIAGSLQRAAPPSCPAEPPNQALGASQTSPCQQKHKGSPVGCRIWDFSRPESLQVLPGQTHRLPLSPAGSKHVRGVSGRRNAPFCFFFSCLQQKTVFYSALDPLFVLWFVSCGTALVALVLVVCTSLVISSTQSY